MNISRNTRHVRHSRSSHQSHSFVENKRKRTIWTIVLFCLIVVLFSFSAVRFFSLSVFEITSIQIFGADQDISASLHDIAEATLQGKYFGLFDRSNVFIYPTNALVATIKVHSPRVSDVAIHRDGWHTLIISITEKTPTALVCTNLPDWNGPALSLDSSDTCYFADQTGYIFEQAPVFSGHIYNRYYVPDVLDTATNTDSAIGLYATSTAEFTALQSLYNGVRADAIDAEAVLIKPYGEYEMYASSRAPSENISTTTPLSIIYFNNTRSFDEQLQNLGLFWKNMMDQARAQKKLLNFDYIDVRYGSNVFYKKI